MRREFEGDISLALAAYIAGPGAVHKYEGVPPYPEVRSFVEKVKKEYQRLAGLNKPKRNGRPGGSTAILF